jgi:transcriptional regulator with XRE-family HTH domain
LGDLIRQNRLRRELGLMDVAKACQCSVQFISNIEHGRAPLPWDKVKPLAQFLKVPVEVVRTANLSVRSDFRSFAGASSQRSLSLAAITVDDQLRKVIERYQGASQASKKRFVKQAIKMLDARR